MYYALIIYPRLSKELSQAIDEIRQIFDPTAGYLRAHVTVIFPVPASVGADRLINHIHHKLDSWEPFEIQLGGFQKSHDHWLFLRLVEGDVQIKQLYQAIYTGLLKEYRRPDIDFVPHIGLGLFIKEVAIYNWDHPNESDFDAVRYEDAMIMAKNLPLQERSLVDKLHLIALPEQIIQWAAGMRDREPMNVRIDEIQAFRLLPSR